jgi:hypothetical protein
MPARLPAVHEGNLTYAGGVGRHGLLPLRGLPRDPVGRAPQSVRGRWLGHSWVHPGVATAAGKSESRRVVLPAAAVTGDLVGGEVAVFDLDSGTATLCRQPDLQRAGAGWKPVRAGISPADDEPVGRLEFEKPPADGRALHVDGEAATGRGFEQSVVAHPADDRFGVGEVFVHAARRRVDVDRCADEVSFQRRTPRRA